MDAFEKSFKILRAVLKEKKWPGVEEGENWGTPSLKCKGRMLARIREPGVLVLMCNLEAKEMLLQVAPHIYFELPHYKGYPAILARMDIIEPDEIAEMIEEYWRKIAPKKMVAEFDERKPPTKRTPSKKSQAASAVKTKPAAKTISRTRTRVSKAKATKGKASYNAN